MAKTKKPKVRAKTTKRVDQPKPKRRAKFELDAVASPPTEEAPPLAADRSGPIRTAGSGGPIRTAGGGGRIRPA